MGTPSDDDLRPTRLALQAVAEHVLAAALYRATGHIGLRRGPGGITTPPFPVEAAGEGPERTIAIVGTDLVVLDGRGERRAPLTTLRAAGELAEVTPGAPAAVYTPATALDLDASLALDADAAARLASWYALVGEAIEAMRADATRAEPSVDAPIAQIWPEHFDLATSIAEVNYGGSPGDDAHPLPYLYVGPFSAPPRDAGFWNESFGASRSEPAVRSVDDALAFFREGRERVTPAP
jgi:hypothetical protein